MMMMMVMMTDEDEEEDEDVSWRLSVGPLLQQALL